MSSVPCGNYNRCGIVGKTQHVVSRFLIPNSIHLNVKSEAYASKGRGRKSARFGEDKEELLSDDEDDEEREKDDHLSDDEVEDDDETAGQKTWKDMSIHATSLRIDVILSGGLGISRKKIEDAFLDARLMLNNKIISKKSKTVRTGDIVDMVLKGRHEESTDSVPSVAVMRVKVLQIGEEVTSKERIPVKLRRWKYLKV